MTTPAPSAPMTRWRWTAAIWFAAALFAASQSIFVLHAEGKEGGELRLFFVQLVTWLPWALLTPLIVTLGRRYPILPRPTARGAVIHVAALSAISAVADAWSAALQVAFNPWSYPQWPEFWTTWSQTFVFQTLVCTTTYILIVTITHLVDSRDSVARQMSETARLNEELSKAQLAALRRQMEPHLMFNTLHSIAGLVRDNSNAAAVNMIVGLSEFLRRATEDFHKPVVTLAEEVEYLQRYIDIQKVRFGPRLVFSADIPADLMKAEVPSLLLQPLVENALKHGLAERVAGGEIRVAAGRRGAMLHLSVYNDGSDVAADWESRTAGVGLANLRTRLQIMHGGSAALLVQNVDGGGVEVTVTLPLVESA